MVLDGTHLGGPRLQGLAVVSEVAFISLSHSLHHQFGYGSHVQACRNNKGSGSVSGGASSSRRVDRIRPTGVGGELQAPGAALRLGDGLQERSILRHSHVGGQLADVAGDQVGLLVSNQEGHIGLQHVHTHLVLREKQEREMCDHRFVSQHPQRSVPVPSELIPESGKTAGDGT